MKKTIIGGILVLIGTLISIGIMIAAAIVVPSITGWSGSSKLWFAIFGTKQYDNQVSQQSLFMGFPFIVGIILLLIGLIVLGIEYFKHENKITD